VIVTDDLVSFRTVAINWIEQQICQFHLRRWVSNPCGSCRKTFTGMQWVLEEIRRLLAELPPEGSQRLFELWKQVPERRIGQAGERSPLNNCAIYDSPSEHWDSYRVFDWQPDVPWTTMALSR